MFKRVLIAEDFDIINDGLKDTLLRLNVPEVARVTNCDDALLQLKNAVVKNKPFDLLISDLSFVGGYGSQKITRGEQLVEEVKKHFEDLKIIVFSVEDRPYKIQNLYRNLKVDAYVCKNRNGKREIENAIKHLSHSDSFFISPALSTVIHPKSIVNITKYDLFLLKCLSEGMLQQKISVKLKENGYNPFSVSAIEKRIKILKDYFNAQNLTHLVVLVKDYGFI